MIIKLYKKLRNIIDTWLSEEPSFEGIIPYDFNRMKYEIKPGDVLLVEGHSRVSNVIRAITQSSWTHAALYIGRLSDIEDENIRKIIKEHAPDARENTRLIIESLLDRGNVITPITFYQKHHLRICRPIGITPSDTHLVINYMVRALGQPYNVRQLLDLMRFLLPWTLLPRRWGSSLFRTSSGQADSGICSSLIAEAFSSVQFPILPFLKSHEEAGIEVFQRNPHLYTPKDFDYSPYFEIIKYPLFNPDEPLPYYRRLPWTKTGFIHQDHGILTAPPTTKAKTTDEKAEDLAKKHKSEKKKKEDKKDSSHQ